MLFRVLVMVNVIDVSEIPLLWSCTVVMRWCVPCVLRCCVPCACVGACHVSCAWYHPQQKYRDYHPHNSSTTSTTTPPHRKASNPAVTSLVPDCITSSPSHELSSSLRLRCPCTTLWIRRPWLSSTHDGCSYDGCPYDGCWLCRYIHSPTLPLTNI